MGYQALYRTWRPQTFADMVGQPHVKQTLTNAILRSQVAHAYLFCGPRGTGKTSAAKVLAKAVNCTQRNGVEPCNECDACRSITVGSNVDVEEIDAASNRGVDEIRLLRDKVQYAPANLAQKVYIVDEVHMLTTEAFNALLKTLEEPPSHALFILATTEPHKIPATIVSRCQRFDFRRIEPESIVDRLRTVCEDAHWTYEEDALWKIAEAADGGLRDALGLLEQTSAYGQGTVTAEGAAHVMGGVQTADLLQLLAELAEEDLLSVLQRLMTWYQAGKDAQRIVQEILHVLRDLFIVKMSGAERQEQTGYREVAEKCSRNWLLHAVKTLGETYVNLRFVDQPRLALETALLGLAPSLLVEPQTRQIEERPARRPAANGNGGGDTARESTGEAAPQSTVADAGKPDRGTMDSTAIDSGKPVRAATTAKTSTARKLEVLGRLAQEADDKRLSGVVSQWETLLQRVREIRIQTHAWLINGTPVLTTPSTLVLSFSSRIHRDAVMKPDEREAIETALNDLFQEPIQVLALLQSDWDAWLKSHQAGTDASPPEERGGNDLVDRVVRLFGEDIVDVTDD